MSLQDLLKSLQFEIQGITDADDFLCHHILEDLLTVFQKGLDFTSSLCITFLGELAVDAIGPYRLLMSAVILCLTINFWKV